MSILIKGMKMPHSCIGCRFCEHGSINEWDLYCGIDNKHVGNWDDKHINNGWRRPDCPLVEVPFPHGPLIDANIVCYQLEKQATIDGQPRAIRRARKIVADAPTIIEAEEGEEA